jgi:hypothetical protein
MVGSLIRLEEIQIERSYYFFNQSKPAIDCCGWIIGCDKTLLAH